MVSKMSTLQTVLFIATIKCWHLHQMDVQSVFLHDVLDEEIFMCIPQGHPSILRKIVNTVCRLNASIYSLKQASRVWF